MADFFKPRIACVNLVVFDEIHNMPCRISKFTDSVFPFVRNLLQMVVNCEEFVSFFEQNERIGKINQIAQIVFPTIGNLLTLFIKNNILIVFRHYICYHFSNPDSWRAQLLVICKIKDFSAIHTPIAVPTHVKPP